MHWRGSCMVGTARKSKFHASLPGNCLNRSERPPQRFQDRPLLYVKFQVRKTIVLQRGARNLCGIQAVVFDGCPNGDSIRVPAIQDLLVKPPDQRTAADERRSESDSFFFRE